ncbi:hypothetical protein Athai_27500 [Actinocatenispora thailandica]|uniref:Potassium channel domain-containing protein n=1 Tax=Actinocatenispora thailandica TaxID=227318 RepID=A0A7R7DP89_9ACTN|nr:potassium channel family protein [Actinocatenispora thailandica]BCJ35247.1 hypothetical protein Athai_27500 [Actinocatenispora thailandica]
MSDTPQPVVPAGRLRRLWRRTQQPDAYGVVLLAVLLSLIGTGFGGVGGAGAVVLLTLALLFAIHTAGYPTRLVRAAAPVGAAAVAALLAAAVTGSQPLAIIGDILTLLLVAATIALVLARVGRSPRITLATITAALSVYLLVAVGYADAFGLIGAARPPFFAGTGGERAVDYLYFSLVTITTTGYGDLVARGDLGRMVAASEAVLGQLYLVTVVAMAVANLGHARRHDLRRPPPPER